MMMIFINDAMKRVYGDNVRREDNGNDSPNNDEVS